MFDRSAISPSTLGDSNARYDAVIVGGRVAGASTALLLARRGHRVLVIDRDQFPSDTMSTHLLQRTGLVQLRRWGLLDRVLASGAPRLEDLIFHHGGAAIHRAVKDRHGIDALLAPRRIVLDQIIRDAAIEAGAEFIDGVSIDDVIRDTENRVIGVAGRRGREEVVAYGRIVVGADGARSRLARAVEAPVIESHLAMGAASYAYFEGSWSVLEHYVGHRSAAGVFPTHNGEACIWVGMPSSEAEDLRRKAGDPLRAFDTMLRQVDRRLHRQVTHARRTSPIRGTMKMTNDVRQAGGPGWALVGDAGVHRDAIAGHGISDALRDAELLANALHQTWIGELEEHHALVHYERQRAALMRDVFDLTLVLASYPPGDQIIDLHVQLARAIDEQAGQIAAWPTATTALSRAV